MRLQLPTAEMRVLHALIIAFHSFAGVQTPVGLSLLGLNIWRHTPARCSEWHAQAPSVP